MEATATSSSTNVGEGERYSSFAKSLFLGEIHDEMVFPWPEPQSRTGSGR